MKVWDRRLLGRTAMGGFSGGGFRTVRARVEAFRHPQAGGAGSGVHGHLGGVRPDGLPREKKE